MLWGTEQIRVRALGTHVKISQLAASLQTSRQQVVFAQLVTSCQQVWNKLLTTCNNLADIIRRYKVVPTRLLQSWYNNIVTALCGQPCNILVISWLHQTCWNNLVTSLIMLSSSLQVVDNLVQTCYNKLGTSSANTTCWQLVNRLVTTCLQTCNNLCVFTRVPALQKHSFNSCWRTYRNCPRLELTIAIKMAEFRFYCNPSRAS